MLPGPVGRGTGPDPLGAGQRSLRQFLDNYYTTLVGLMAAAMRAVAEHSSPLAQCTWRAQE